MPVLGCIEADVLQADSDLTRSTRLTHVCTAPNKKQLKFVKHFRMYVVLYSLFSKFDLLFAIVVQKSPIDCF